jgi:amino acid transporter
MHANKMGLWEAVSIAVGTMIGASIFSIFGVGAEIAGQNLPWAFVLSGFYALAVAYSYAKLGTKIVSNAGPIAFILHGIGDGLITGALSLLMWLTYVVSIGMFAKGFAGYFLPLFNLDVNSLSRALTEIAVILLFLVLNFFGSRVVGRAEKYIVLVKIGILGLFVALGVLSINGQNVRPQLDTEHASGLVHASLLFFLSYMGFGLISNASENIRNPSRTVPRAIYTSVAIVMFIYVMVALVAVGNLSPENLTKAGENALAVATKPFMGSLGFLLISVGALFSISSALNATLYGGANSSYALAKMGELPRFFDRKIWFHSIEGLYLTAGLSILFALFFDMGGIASITATVFSVIYIFVLVSHLRLIGKVGGKRAVVIFNLTLLILIFLGLVHYQWESQTSALVGTLVVFAGALLAEAVFRHVAHRHFPSPRR